MAKLDYRYKRGLENMIDKRSPKNSILDRKNFIERFH